MKIVNKDAARRFTIEDKLTSGIMLTGPEVKSARLGHVDLAGSYVSINKNGVELIGMHISPYKYARNDAYNPKRTRKLLLNKAEIQSLSTKTTHSSLTIIPLSLYTIGAFFKVEVGIAKGKKKKDIRQDLKKAAIQRDIDIETKKYK